MDVHVNPYMEVRYEVRGSDAKAARDGETCTTPEDILALAKDEGYELSDEELETVSGSGWGGEKKYKVECQHCHQVFEAPESWLGC